MPGANVRSLATPGPWLPHRPNRERLGAAIGAAIAGLALLGPWVAGTERGPALPVPPAAPYSVWLAPAPPLPRQMPAHERPETAPPRTVERVNRQPPLRPTPDARTPSSALPTSPVETGVFEVPTMVPESRPEPGPTGQPIAREEAVTPPESPASSPLRWDGETLRRATAGVKGSVRTLAEQAGTELDAPRATVSQRQAEGMARAGKANCLAPAEEGSLLSLPAAAIAALRGKCR